jgi:hypothetical protein
MIFVAISLLLTAVAGHAQQVFGHDSGETAPFEFGAGYTYMHSNAPPSGCGCFSLNGGFVSMAVHAVHGFALAADLSATHAGNVNNTSQNITVFNYLFGPRFYYHPGAHYTVYVQALGGGSKETSNFSGVNGANAVAAAFGGGLNVRLSRHVAWNAVEADYIYSALPNGANNFQSDVRVSTGIIFRTGPR